MKALISKLFGTTRTIRRAAPARLGQSGIALDDRSLMSVTTGSMLNGITWTFDYNASSKVGTFTVNATDAAERLALQEVLSNANPHEPGYGDTRAYGVNVVNQANGDESGVSFAPGSTITLVVNGRGGNDSLLNGTRFPSRLDGGAGNDLLTGGEAADTLAGGAGNDALDGKGGNDLLVGGLNDDTLFGGAGNDDLWGDDRVQTNGAWVGSGSGKDQLIGNMGHDTLRGGGGADILTGDHGRRVTVNGVQIWQSLASDASGTAGNDVLYGEAGDDTLQAGYGNDTLDGGAGSDWLFGGAGNDSLSGGADRDYLYGGDGTDTLSGGAATDFIRTGSTSVDPAGAISYNDPFWGVNDFFKPHTVDSRGDNDNEANRIG